MGSTGTSVAGKGREAGVSDIASTDAERRHIANLLSSMERESHVSQRKLAAELGVALGLVNTYIKRCVKKGLIKVQQVPTRRYAYFLTPQGFAEKSRLTAEYLTWSLTFFRMARHDCAEVVADAGRRGWRSIGLAGGGDLAEIAMLCAAEQGVKVAALVDPGLSRATVLGAKVVAQSSDVSPTPHGWIITAVDDAQRVYDALVLEVGRDRVLAPSLLSIKFADEERAP
jgi:DNA-binding MarR family transcriptional regulator